MKSGYTFKIPRNVGGNGYWSILIPRVPNQVMTLKCAVMCVPLQYKPSVHHQSFDPGTATRNLTPKCSRQSLRGRPIANGGDT